MSEAQGDRLGHRRLTRTRVSVLEATVRSVNALLTMMAIACVVLMGLPAVH